MVLEPEKPKPLFVVIPSCGYGSRPRSMSSLESCIAGFLFLVAITYASCPSSVYHLASYGILRVLSFSF